MRIAVDARFLGPRGKGLGRYVEKLLKYLAIVDQHNEYFVLLRDENWQSWQSPNERWHRVRAPWRWYTTAEQIHLPRLLYSLKVDLVHFPHFNVPLLYTGKFVVTIHDLILSRYPTERASTLEPFYFWLKHLAYRLIIRSATKRAKHIITVSNFSRDEIVGEFGVKPERVSVTYEAVDPGAPAQPGAIGHLLNRIGVNRPYFLYVGNAYPHKNIERLIEAFGRLLKYGYDYQLVLVGGMDYFYQRVRRYAEAAGLVKNKRVIFPGFVSDDVLASLYAGCFTYVFPSKAEGFGLPPLEAMQYGAPVVSSNATCLPEILGGAALYFDPEDINSMRQALERVCTDETLRMRLAQLGPEHVRRYSWSRMAEQTLAVYQSVVQS